MSDRAPTDGLLSSVGLVPITKTHESYVQVMRDLRGLGCGFVIDNFVGRAHGMMTLAKYVEDEDTLEALRGLGIEYVQGYFIGAAMPACELTPATIRQSATAEGGRHG